MRYELEWPYGPGVVKVVDTEAPGDGVIGEFYPDQIGVETEDFVSYVVGKMNQYDRIKKHAHRPYDDRLPVGPQPQEGA